MVDKESTRHIANFVAEFCTVRAAIALTDAIASMYRFVITGVTRSQKRFKAVGNPSRKISRLPFRLKQELNLSFRALEDYIECPFKYKLVHEINFSESTMEFNKLKGLFLHNLFCIF